MVKVTLGSLKSIKKAFEKVDGEPLRNIRPMNVDRITSKAKGNRNNISDALKILKKEEILLENGLFLDYTLFDKFYKGQEFLHKLDKESLSRYRPKRGKGLVPKWIDFTQELFPHLPKGAILELFENISFLHFECAMHRRQLMIDFWEYYYVALKRKELVFK